MKRQFPIKPLFASCFGWCIFLKTLLLLTPRTGKGRRKGVFSAEPPGMSQSDYTCLPFFLLSTLLLTSTPCCVSSYSLCLWSFAPGVQSLSLNPPSSLQPFTDCLSLETRVRYSCASAMAKSMRHCPAMTNTPPCQLMTLGGIPRFTSPWLPSWVPRWISGKKSPSAG